MGQARIRARVVRPVLTRTDELTNRRAQSAGLIVTIKSCRKAREHFLRWTRENFIDHWPISADNPDILECFGAAIALRELCGYAHERPAFVADTAFILSANIPRGSAVGCGPISERAEKYARKSRSIFGATNGHIRNPDDMKESLKSHENDWMARDTRTTLPEKPKRQ